jgi:hypothetical protein
MPVNGIKQTFSQYGFEQNFGSNLVVPASYIIYYNPDNQLYYAEPSRERDDLQMVTGADASTVIQSAINALTNGGRIFIKTGLYLIYSPIELKSNVDIYGEGWSTILKLADNRPNSIPENWVDHCVLWHESGAIENITIKDLQIDGNKANQAFGNINHGIACIYIGNTEESQNVKIINCYVHDHLQFGIEFDYGPYHDYKVLYCKVINNNYNDISFICGNNEVYLCEAIGNTVGGNTGDMGIAVYSWGSGSIHHINIVDNVVLTMTGAGSSGEYHCGIRLETGAQYCLVQGNIIYNNKIGIQTHPNSLGYHTIVDNVIYLRDFSGELRGILIEDDYSQVRNNYIVGHLKLAYEEFALMSESTANNNTYTNNYIRNCRYGFWLKGDNEVIEQNNFINCNTPIGFHPDASGYIIKSNVGYVSENSGTATISASTSVVVTHGLAGTPNVVTVTPRSTGYGTFAVTARTSTTFTITVTTSGTYTFDWYAEYHP